jgi:hypothetical protein
MRGSFMVSFLSTGQRVLYRTLTIATFIVFITVTNFGLLTLPSHAATLSSQASGQISAEDKTDRAYEETEAAGLQEEIYQQRVQEGQRPEAMPQPFKRIVDAKGKEVPQTSWIETSVSKARQLTQKMMGE